MSRYTGSSYKKARRVGISLLENGKDIARRPYGPGDHGANKRGKLSNYGSQTLEEELDNLLTMDMLLLMVKRLMFHLIDVNLEM